MPAGWWGQFRTEGHRQYEPYRHGTSLCGSCRGARIGGMHAVYGLVHGWMQQSRPLLGPAQAEQAARVKEHAVEMARAQARERVAGLGLGPSGRGGRVTPDALRRLVAGGVLTDVGAQRAQRAQAGGAKVVAAAGGLGLLWAIARALL